MLSRIHVTSLECTKTWVHIYCKVLLKLRYNNFLAFVLMRDTDEDCSVYGMSMPRMMRYIFISQVLVVAHGAI